MQLQLRNQQYGLFGGIEIYEAHINDEISGAISQACSEIIDGKWHENFPIDMVQGDAGISVNMNAKLCAAN